MENQDFSTTMITLFYSNYSGNCKALLQYLKNLNIQERLSIKYINIDNNIVKDYITTKITHVPSMVVIEDNNTLLITGSNVFEWFNLNIKPEKLKTPDKVEIPPIKKKSLIELALEISKERDKF